MTTLTTMRKPRTAAADASAALAGSAVAVVLSGLAPAWLAPAAPAGAAVIDKMIKIDGPQCERAEPAEPARTVVPQDISFT
jgi:hypothetical protein